VIQLFYLPAPRHRGEEKGRKAKRFTAESGRSRPSISRWQKKEKRKRSSRQWREKGKGKKKKK